MKYNTSHFLDKLIAHEGLVLTVYQDTLGIDTIGIGRNLKDRGISKEELDHMDIPSMAVVYEHGITEADARYLAMNDMKIVEDELTRVHPCVNDLDAVRQLILMDMAFNMGVRFTPTSSTLLDGRCSIRGGRSRLVRGPLNFRMQWSRESFDGKGTHGC